jgi:DNA-binding response OmpR family regulator
VEQFNVLLVDDEVDFVDTLAKRLELREFVVHGVHRGEAALEALETFPAEVVVLDVMMPGIGGVETLRQIKKRYPSIEVIILTGYTSTETAIEVMEIGAFDYLIKPIAFEELLYRLQDAYHKKVSAS